MEPDEKLLILEAQRGESHAFDTLVRKYDTIVFSIALKYARSKDDAKDIYQETFLRVYRNIDKFEFRSEFSTWVFRIATNVCLTHYAKKKKDKTVSLDAETGDEQNGESLKDMLSGDQVQPDKELHNKHIADKVRDAVNLLPPQQKLVFTLKHFEGYKLREIADIMDCAEGTVKKYLFTAIRKLRIDLQDVIA
jgi:RNA polymerase sigma-70 factor (ECF subfamily)